MPFYAVAKGRVPGIYTTWTECEAQVTGFNSAKYRKFNTRPEAWAFVNDTVPGTSSNETGLKRESDGVQAGTSSKKSKIDSLKNREIVGLKTFGKYSFPVDNDGFVHVYTDGSCEANGSVIACAGLGVYFMDGHALNTAQAVKGRPTNNSGEIQAAILALQLVKKHDIQKLQINTDSMYLIQAVTSWMPTWKKKKWQKTQGGELKNLVDFQELDKHLTPNIEVRWNHVAGHAGIIGNEKADKLAREGAQMYRDQLQN